ncbi:MFS transporter [Haemophilus parainfluenzae]|jgi:putative metabolite transport protein HI_0281|uniref:MFS transporter n=1 Tax=Haemophilus parainfluenzae ATCC 33392 TaxID=888828 RepID=A0ABD7ZFL8_HAEPA|nr:MFS transporter [Haemophilus parainfluenzae]EGC72616.1 MFS transporter, metabolite:H+ symporter (MHS) family protein [Haemophilus parainfluenzae ATCC 33392]KFL98275.1 MFS transporter, metabolite:H+ symporter (MHS) family protein [Haemophilus parainfluenzae ATCC 33392]OBX69795.1 transporter [Haemophilus parainfluenzae]PMC57130.1 MFS transporter [Haemophilus parainfluenzae]QQB23355.1 MHS family MFS transporter [Haemophilus parainfluenzae]
MSSQLRNDPLKVALASMVGTAIEFFDYYIYAAAAVLVFNTQFFHSGDPLSDDLLSLSTLALAFFARPIGSALFGHFGDKIGRKKTLVASLVLMGGSTVVIGLLPTYSQIGIWAPILLCICRVGQGIGLGGEWGGAALVATENAPEGKRAWYGTFPQLGAPIGLFVANATFFLVSYFWGQQALVEWAWRIPFISSLALVLVGLYVRLTLHESHVFIEAEEKGKKLKAPVSVVFTKHFKPMVIGTFIMVATYSLFYIMTAFAQAYSRTPATLSEAGYPMGLGIPANTFTGLLLMSAIVFAICISISGLYADKIGRRKWLIWTTVSILIFALCMPLFLGNGTPTSVFAFLVIGMALMGMTFGPMAALLPELFPTEVRYSGASLAYNIASIIGATIAAMISLKINALYGLMGVGIYLAINAFLTLLALLASKETKNVDLTQI